MMDGLDTLFSLEPYSLSKAEKDKILISQLDALNQHHLNLCVPYRQMVEGFGLKLDGCESIESFFPLPVRLFKHYELRSVEQEQVLKTLTSSGTTSAGVSRIFLDKETTKKQTKALSAIMKSFLGPKRLPMIILDTESVIKDRKMFSARGGGIVGLSNFGRNHLYLFDDDMNIRFDALDAFLEVHDEQPIFLFGFTFMVWLYFVQSLANSGRKLDISNGILVHSGGWKKLESQKVDNAEFKHQVEQVSGISRIHNFYGMVEQMGSVYMECEAGYFHASNFSDVLIRDPQTRTILPDDESGLIETLSVLPSSYPGHAILTEDLGVVHGTDNCSCGRKGKYFTVLGRLPKAEVRGCSDSYEA